MNRSYLLHIIFRIAIIAGIGFIAGYLVANHKPIYLIVILLLLVVVFILNLIHYLNKVNERINYFFEAVINEDFTLSHSSRSNNSIVQRLNQNLERVTQKMQQIKLESLKQEHYFKALIEHVGTGILTYNDNGFVIHANGSLKNLLGLTQFTHLKQLDKVNQNLAKTLRQMKDQEQRLITIHRSQNQTNILIKATPLKFKNQQLMLLSVQDIDQELDEKELDSWLKLIRVLTHEIMNSIAPVTSLSDSLSSYFIRDGKAIPTNEITDKIIETTIRGLDVISEQGKGLINFVDSYRKLTRLPKPEKTNINIPDFFKKVVLLCQAYQTHPSLTITIQKPNDPIPLIADENLITQVMVNILKNAIEALKDTNPAIISISAFVNSKNQVELAVRDNGPGIPVELMSEIFVPFFTTKQNGNGIGLSLSRQIMRLHGGTIRVQSEPNQDTVFSLVFKN